MYQLTIKAAAYEMLNDAYQWYEQQLSGLGERFLDEIDRCFEKLRTNPHYYSKLDGNFRRILPAVFPYKIIF